MHATRSVWAPTPSAPPTVVPQGAYELAINKYGKADIYRIDAPTPEATAEDQALHARYEASMLSTSWISCFFLSAASVDREQPPPILV